MATITDKLPTEFQRTALGRVAAFVLAILVLGLGASPAAAQPPSNDNFPGDSFVDFESFYVDSTTVGSTGQAGEPKIAGSFPDRTVWYTIEAVESGPMTLSLANSAFNTTLAVFTGDSVGALTPVASNNDFNGTLQSKLSFNAVAGGRYRVVIDGWGSAEGLFRLQWSHNPPAHDDFAHAATITGAAGTHAASIDRATIEPGELALGGSSRSVWYSWTAPESGDGVVTTRGSGFDTRLTVYTGAAIAGLTQIAHNDDFNGTPQSKLTFPVTSGTTYRIAVNGYVWADEEIDLQWAIDAPQNDDFANPRVLTGVSGSSAASTVRSTGEPGEPAYHGVALGDNSVWFAWTPSISGPAIVRVLNPSGGYSPGIGVYTGAGVGALTTVYGGSTQASFSAVAGTQYQIAVDGTGGSTGTFTLEYVLGRCNGLDATVMGRGAFAGSAGDDVIVGSPAADTIDGGGGDDTICGLGAGDVITGGAGEDKAFGGPGNDTFKEGSVPSGADVLNGQEGKDIAAYGQRGAAVSVSLDAIADDGAGGEGDLVHASVEDVIAGAGADTLTGNALANTLTGNAGADTLKGAGGDDKLAGGPGVDSLFGEAGMDALNLADGAGGDSGDGGSETDTATSDAGDTLVNVP